MQPRFIIFVETSAGEIIRAFTWTRDEQSGINRAKADAIKFGLNVVRVWAEPVKVANP